MEPRAGQPSELMSRLIANYFLGGAAQPRRSPGDAAIQRIPVNVYETPDDVVIVAPMPGVEAENIDIQVVGSTVSLYASKRGPGQDNREYLAHEWSYGPYERTINLPVQVDAEHANASHGNGVLVLSLPKSNRGGSVRIPLTQLTSSEAMHEGHSGHHTDRRDPEDNT